MRTAALCWTHLDDVVESFGAKNLDVPAAFQIDFSSMFTPGGSSSSSHFFLGAVLQKANSVVHASLDGSTGGAGSDSASTDSSPHHHHHHQRHNSQPLFFDPAGNSDSSFWAMMSLKGGGDNTTAATATCPASDGGEWARCIPAGSARRRFREIAQHVVRQIKEIKAVQNMSGNRNDGNDEQEQERLEILREQLSALPSGPARFFGLLRRCHGARAVAILRQLLRLLCASAVAGFVLGKTSPATTALSADGLSLFVSLHRLYHREDAVITDCTAALITLTLYRGFPLTAHEGRVLLALVSKKQQQQHQHQQQSANSSMNLNERDNSFIFSSIFGTSANPARQHQSNSTASPPAAESLSATLRLLSEWLRVAPPDAMQCLASTPELPHQLAAGLESALLVSSDSSSSSSSSSSSVITSCWRLVESLCRAVAVTHRDFVNEDGGDGCCGMLQVVWNSVAGQTKAFVAQHSSSSVSSSLPELAQRIIDATAAAEQQQCCGLSLSLTGTLSLLADCADEVAKGAAATATYMPLASCVDNLLQRSHEKQRSRKNSPSAAAAAGHKRSPSPRDREEEEESPKLPAIIFSSKSTTSVYESLWRLVSSSAFRPTASTAEDVFTIDQIHRLVRSAAYRSLAQQQQQQQQHQEEDPNQLFDITRSALEQLQQNHPAAADNESVQLEFVELLRIISSCAEGPFYSAEQGDAVLDCMLRFIVATHSEGSEMRQRQEQEEEEEDATALPHAAAGDTAIAYALDRSCALLVRRPVKAEGDAATVKLLFDAIAVATLLRQTGQAESAARNLLCTMQEEAPHLFSPQLFIQQALISLSERSSRFAVFGSNAKALDHHIAFLLERAYLSSSACSLQHVGVTVLLMQQLAAVSSAAPFHKSMQLCGRILQTIFSSAAAATSRHQQQQQQSHHHYHHAALLPQAKRASLLSVLHGYQMQKTLSISASLIETVDAIQYSYSLDNEETWAADTASALGTEPGAAFLALLCDLLPESEQQPFFADLVDCTAAELVRLHKAAPGRLAAALVVEGGLLLLRGDTQRLIDYFNFAASSVSKEAAEILQQYQQQQQKEEEGVKKSSSSNREAAMEKNKEEEKDKAWKEREQALIAELQQSQVAKELVDSIVQSAGKERRRQQETDAREAEVALAMLELCQEAAARHCIVAEEADERGVIFVSALCEARGQQQQPVSSEGPETARAAAATTTTKSSGHVGRLRKLREEAGGGAADAGADDEAEDVIEDTSPIRKSEQDEEEAAVAQQEEEDNNDVEPEEEIPTTTSRAAPAAAHPPAAAAGSGISAVRGSLIQQWQDEVSTTNTVAEDEIVLLRFDTIDAMREAMRHERLALQRERKETRQLSLTLGEAIAELRDLLDRHSAERYHSAKYGDQTRMLQEEQELLHSSRSKTKDTECRILRTLLTRRSAALMELDAALDMQSSMQSPMRLLVYTLNTRCQMQAEELDRLSRKLQETEDTTSKRAKRTDELRLRENDELQRRLASLELELARIRTQQPMPMMQQQQQQQSQPTTARRGNASSMSTARSHQLHHSPSGGASRLVGASAGASNPMMDDTL